MPELPEVETIVRELKRKVSGEKLVKFQIFDKRIGRFAAPSPLKVTAIDRHGKYIIFHTNRAGKILFHLRMSGRLLLKKRQSGMSSLPEKYERARFYFASGLVLQFFDPRRFGTIEWRKENLPEIGLNPLGKDFVAEKLKNILSSRSRAIKNLLLDQKIIGGLGNIYADESLWLAKIHPRRKSDSLSGAEALLLRSSIVKVLREAIKKGGFTLRDYRKTGGESGRYQLFRKVYGRAGEPCRRCGKKIAALKIGGRTAHFCPDCQGGG